MGKSLIIINLENLKNKEHIKSSLFKQACSLPHGDKWLVRQHSRCVCILYISIDWKHFFVLFWQVNNPKNTSYATVLKIEEDHVVKNLQVEPAKISQNCDLPETNTLLENPTNEEMFSCDEKPDVELESSELTEKLDQYGADPYCYRGKLSSGGLSKGYDCPHAQVEMSPGDVVAGYGTWPGLFLSHLSLSDQLLFW